MRKRKRQRVHTYALYSSVDKQIDGARITSNEAKLRERSGRGRFLFSRKKAPLHRGAYRVSLFNFSVGGCVRACVRNIRRFY